MVLVIYSPKLLKYSFRFSGSNEPIWVSVIEHLTSGLEGTVICWLFFWKKERTNFLEHFKKRDTFNEPTLDDLDNIPYKT